MLRGPIRFTNALADTSDFIYPGPSVDMQSPATANAVNGAIYTYYAQSLDMSEWEVGSGAYTSASGTFARTTVAANHLGTTAKIDFTYPPQVMVLQTDMLSSAEVAALIAGFVSATAAQSWTAAQKAQARANIDALKKNYFVNGAMMISQENGSSVVGLSGTAFSYIVDQSYCAISSAGSVNAQRVASASPAGSPNRFRVTVTGTDTSVGAGDYVLIEQPIEGTRVADLLSGTASAKTITVKFGVKAPAGTYAVAIRNAPTFNRSYVAEFTISGGEANTDVVKSVTIPLDTSGTWATDTSSGIMVTFCLMCGSTRQTTAGAWQAGSFIGTANVSNFMDTNGAVFELFDVGVYEGSAAPSFQVPDYPAELALCNRYYFKTFAQATNPAQNVGAGTGEFVFVATVAGAATNRSGVLIFPVKMRAAPTVTTYNPAAASAEVRDINAAANCTAISLVTTETTTRVICTANAATAVGNALGVHITANARM